MGTQPVDDRMRRKATEVVEDIFQQAAESMKAAFAERDMMRDNYEAQRRNTMAFVDDLTRLRMLVDEQAEDEGLWFVNQSCSEAYLQQALRKMHALIERHFGRCTP